MTSSIQVARSRLIVRYPWWASLVLRLDIIIDETIETAGTDGKRLFYNPAWWEALTPQEEIGVLAHEALHCGFLHHLRRGNRDGHGWNIACDFAINFLLIEDEVVLPKGRLYDKKYKNMSAEQIYDLLPHFSFDFASCGSVIDGDAEHDEKCEWSKALVDTLHARKLAGKDPGNIDRAIEQTIAPKIPWRELLWNSIHSAAGKDDYTWKRPSRRGLAYDLYLPSLYADQCDPLMIAIDTSASMDVNDISEAVAICRDALNEIRPTNTTIVYADTKIQSMVELEPDDLFSPATLKGGGGTDFRPVFEMAKQSTFCAVVYITDLEGPFPGDYHDPAFFLTRSPHQAPFGVTINLEDLT